MPNKLTITFAAAAIACALAAPAHAVLKISNTKTKGVTCSGGVCTPTTGNANLNIGDLETMLAAADVTVKSNATATDIGIVDPLTWASTHRLTLDAYDSIHVRAPIVVEGTAGVTLMTNDGGANGDYTFNTDTSGSITFWDTASSLIINNRKFKLVKDLSTLSFDATSDPSGHYALAGSYNASPDGAYSRPPIPKPFSGVFEGLGNSVLNLTVNVEDNDVGAGLFNDNRGLIRDITLVSAHISALFYESGPVAAENEGKIEHASSINGTVRNQLVAGGLTGSNEGLIQFASTSGKTTGAVAGGIAGENNGGGSIRYCRSSGNVTATAVGRKAGPKTAGGLVGKNFGGSITQSFATGIVSAANNHGKNPPLTGGLVGVNRGGAISYSYATGGIDGGYASAGGLVGLNARGSYGFSPITQSYSTGAVNAVSGFGGFVGGLIGEDDDARGEALAYWDLDTSGISNPHQGAGSPLDDPGITGLTDAQLKSALPAGFDPNVWGQDPNINNGWPYLLANPPPQ